MKRDALFSQCRRFRFELTRDWDSTLPRLLYVMLNPSTADAERDDPTIRKCVGFARRMGFGGFTVVNLFALMATDPADLKRASYERHPDEDEELGLAMERADAVVCAWGSNARKLARPAEVMALIRRKQPSLTLRALAMNGDGTPAHPLMLGYGRVPEVDPETPMRTAFDGLPAIP